MISVGNLDTPITIEKPTLTTNSNYGSVTTSWANAGSGGTIISKVWAYVIFRGGGESDEADQQVGVQKVDFFIRYETYKDLIQPTWRIKYYLSDHTPTSPSVKYYYIDKIDHIDGRHKMTKLHAVEKDNNN